MGQMFSHVADIKVAIVNFKPVSQHLQTLMLPYILKQFEWIVIFIFVSSSKTTKKSESCVKTIFLLKNPIL